MKEKQRRTNDERNRKTEIVKIIGKPKREFSNVNLNSVDVFFEINSWITFMALFSEENYGEFRCTKCRIFTLEARRKVKKKERE